MDTLARPSQANKNTPQNDQGAAKSKLIKPMILISFILTLVVGFGAGALFTTRALTESHANANVNAAAVMTAYWGDAPSRWLQLAQVHPSGSIAIANFNAGPPSSGNDSTFAQDISEAHTSGLQVVGYVPTSHTARSISSVEHLIDGWYSYQVDGIFLDEGTASQGNLSYYQTLANYIRSKHGAGNLVVFNAGWIPATSSYLNVADITMIFEDTANNFSRFSVPSWVNNSTRFAAIVQNVPSSQINNVIQQAANNHIGYVYTIPDSQDYGQLPSYWSQESFSLKGVPSSGLQLAAQPTPAQPTPTPTPAPVDTNAPASSCVFAVNGSTMTGCSGNLTVNGQSACTFTVNNGGAVEVNCPKK